jgi:hypothetical protein
MQKLFYAKANGHFPILQVLAVFEDERRKEETLFLFLDQTDGT